PGLSGIRLDFHSPLKLDNSFAGFSHMKKNNAEVISGFNAIRVDLDRFPVIHDRIVQPPALQKRVSQIKIAFSRIWLYSHSFLEMPCGSFRKSVTQESQSKSVVRSSIMWIRF